MIKPKKSLGQNFLINNDIIKQIVSLENVKDKNILEIGKNSLWDTAIIIPSYESTVIKISCVVRTFEPIIRLLEPTRAWRSTS